MIGGISTVKPELETPFPSERRTWTCPHNGLIVPVRESENIAYRENLLHRAAADSVLQQELLAACAKSPIFFIDSFVWTLWEQQVSTETWGNVPAQVALHPFVCWPRQEELIDFIWERFRNGEDGLIDKSRDLGASWLCMAFCDWLLLFRQNTQIRCMSRTED
ncbi:MAG: hypothetical protein IMZ50_07585, partial [Candidatus Atribacteria bacterium]|nr:hypothetical protein [Candidatus Atribacteria bacterium]